MKTLLEKKDLLEIVNNVIFTSHVLQRARERVGNFTKEELLDKLKHSSTAWINIDHTINIAISDKAYIILKKEENKYIALTIKGESKNGVSIARKVYLALQNKSFNWEGKNDNSTTNRNFDKNYRKNKKVRTDNNKRTCGEKPRNRGFARTKGKTNAEHWSKNNNRD